MVTLMLDSTRLEVALSFAEHTLSFRRADVLIERSQIVRVQLTDDAWTWLRGTADPGTYIPRTLAMGTWAAAGGRDFAVIRRHRPGVVLDLEGHDEFQRVVVTTRHGIALANGLNSADKTVPVEAEASVEPAPEPDPAPKPRSPRPRPATA